VPPSHTILTKNRYSVVVFFPRSCLRARIFATSLAPGRVQTSYVLSLFPHALPRVGRAFFVPTDRNAHGGSRMRKNHYPDVVTFRTTPGGHQKLMDLCEATGLERGVLLRLLIQRAQASRLIRGKSSTREKEGAYQAGRQG